MKHRNNATNESKENSDIKSTSKNKKLYGIALNVIYIILLGIGCIGVVNAGIALFNGTYTEIHSVIAIVLLQPFTFFAAWSGDKVWDIISS